MNQEELTAELDQWLTRVLERPGKQPRRVTSIVVSGRHDNNNDVRLRLYNAGPANALKHHHVKTPSDATRVNAAQYEIPAEDYAPTDLADALKTVAQKFKLGIQFTGWYPETLKTAIGGKSIRPPAERFTRDYLLHRPDTALHLAAQGDRSKDVIDKILQGPKSTVKYATDVLQRRYAPAEAVLLKKGAPWDLVRYATGVMHARWPEAEPVILQDFRAATHYAQVLQFEWPELDELARNDPEWTKSWSWIEYKKRRAELQDMGAELKNRLSQESRGPRLPDGGPASSGVGRAVLALVQD